MKKAIKILSIFIVILLVFNAVSIPAWGQDSMENEQILQLNREIEAKKEALKKIQSAQAKYHDLIRQYQSREASLATQLAILDNRLVESQLVIEELQIDIDTLDLEMQKIGLEIQEANLKIEESKKRMIAAIKLLQKEDNRTNLEILLSNDYLSDYLDQIKYLKDINSGVIDSLAEIRASQEQLELNKKDLEEKQLVLKNKKEEIQNRQEVLLSEQQSKIYILEETKESEGEYQKLLAEAKRQQEAAAQDIAGLEKTVRERIELMKQQGRGDEIIASTGQLIWPVPNRTVTATFHDPTYPYRHIFEHPAIDIRADQGTQIKAADSGYVARTKTGGATGYGYIMLVHDDGLATVYGHISKIYVREDEFITQGQIIGLTGGLPGTPGAGRLTTGPHLHFEVRLDGIPVNPLEYLP
ncbi:MAG: peptidoglycan DD-metalloendopeptidase family protein [bacterium]